MSKQLALVTGGAGFIGSHVVDALIALNWRVHVMDDLSSGSRRNVNPKATFSKLDIGNERAGRWILKKRPDVVLHFAAQISVTRSIEDPVTDAETNIHATLKLLDAASKSRVKRFVFAGSGGVLCSEHTPLPVREGTVCDPVSPYGIAKRTIEHYGAFYRANRGLPFVSLRFANVYGPRQNAKGEAGVVSIFTTAMLAGKPTRINGTGLQTRDFIYVDDVVSAVLAMIDHPKLAGPYHVGTGKETNIRDLYKRVAAFAGYGRKPGRGPADRNAPMRSALDSTLLAHDTGWRWRVDLKQGLKQTVEWFRSQRSRKTFFS
jgi:UDP-glucose 4-epimerase